MDRTPMMAPPNHDPNQRPLMAPDPRFDGQALGLAPLLWAIAGVLAIVVVSLALID
jgi:hypothetical protein